MLKPVLAALILLGPAMAAPSDWRYVDPITVSGTEYLAFFDNESVTRTGTSVRFWLRQVLATDYRAFLDSTTLEELSALTAAIDAKVDAGYRPPRLSAPGYTPGPKERDSVLTNAKQIGYIEAAANRGLTSASTTLYEVDCADLRIRVLQVNAITKRGPTYTPRTEGTEPWSHIVPDSLGDIMSRILCGRP